jgi:hypothetical protein
MSQRVDYEAISGARFDQYPVKLRILFGFLQTPGNTKFKVFRDFVRKQNMWDKDKAPALYSIVDISWDKSNVKVGKTAKRLMAARSDTDFQQVLFERLKELNILLVKYVLEALDVQQGGRLHSIHELYRMITSYVYPGKYITLTSFQAWIDWLAASGVIKLIGIRWGLSERGQKIVPELRAMDLDEILEDLEDEEGGGGDDDDDDADDAIAFDDDDDAPAPRASKASAPATRAPAPASARGGDFVFDDDDGGGDFDEEDLFDDLPPEPEPPSDDAIRAAQARFGLEDDDDDDDDDDAPRRAAARTPAAKPMPAPAPVAAPRAARAAAAPARAAAAPAAVAMAPAAAALSVPMVAAPLAVLPPAAIDLSHADSAALVARMTAWHATFADWPAADGPRLGIVWVQEHGDLALLVEVGVFAVLAEGHDAAPQLLAFARKLREVEFFDKLLRGDGFDAAMDALEPLAAEPWARPFIERLVHARRILLSAQAKIDLLDQLKQAETGADAIALVREHLVGPLWREAPFFVVRELVRLGALELDKVRGAVVVPTARLIANAARVGLVRAERLHDLASLLAISEAAAAVAGTAELGFGLALERLDLGL